jgi:hypothetical protein
MTDQDVDEMTIDELRAEVSALREREREIAELLGIGADARMMHELRNVLNELQLLRALAGEKLE